MLKIKDIKEALYKAAKNYPDALVDHQIKHILRNAFNIYLSVSNKNPKELKVCDIGGGIGLFSIGCAVLGFKEVVLVDDFQDHTLPSEVVDSVLDIHRKYNINVVSTDVIREGLKKVDGTFDIITSFDSMEHWHHSPKRLFRQAINLLSEGGLFVLSVPNCVNMRKRITVPLGIGKWSNLDAWYESEIFRGHVREPDVSDLKYIATDLGLKNIKIYGRNWLGYYSPKRWVKVATVIMDHFLRLKPSLCSDIYLVASK